jgi:CRP-like cAMP-binding protein
LKAQQEKHLRPDGPGDILGLSAVLADTVHESSAETLQATRADFVRKGPFLHVLKTSGQLTHMVARHPILAKHTKSFNPIDMLIKFWLSAMSSQPMGLPLFCLTC